jgi:hypothetical protein
MSEAMSRYTAVLGRRPGERRGEERGEKEESCRG